jgi:hypothetical protein
VPALPPYIIEPIWEQLVALLPEREVDHPLGCHRPAFPTECLRETGAGLVFGCAYEKIADEGCSPARSGAGATSGSAWGDRRLAGDGARSYDRMIDLELSEVAVDCCITKAPVAERRRARAQWTGGRKASNARWPWTGGAYRWALTAAANRHDSPLLVPTLEAVRTPGLLPERAIVHLDRGYYSEATRLRPARARARRRNLREGQTRALERHETLARRAH